MNCVKVQDCDAVVASNLHSNLTRVIVISPLYKNFSSTAVTLSCLLWNCAKKTQLWLLNIFWCHCLALVAFCCLLSAWGMDQEIPDYDMDSGDENWLNKQSKKLEVTPLKFETMMDRLEKGSGQTVSWQWPLYTLVNCKIYLVICLSHLARSSVLWCVSTLKS